MAEKDIVERLRARKANSGPLGAISFSDAALMYDAADLITRLRARAPEGYRLMPTKLTHQMRLILEVGEANDDTFEETYANLLSASPEPATAGDDNLSSLVKRLLDAGNAEPIIRPDEWDHVEEFPDHRALLIEAASVVNHFRLSAPPAPPADPDAATTEGEASRPRMPLNDDEHMDCYQYGKVEGGQRLCEDCPPAGYPTEKTRCAPCPRRSSEGGA